MSDVIISVEKLSKKYRLGEIGANSLREVAERFWHRVRGRDPEEEMGRIGETLKEKAEGGNLKPEKGRQTTGAGIKEEIGHQGREGRKVQEVGAADKLPGSDQDSGSENLTTKQLHNQTTTATRSGNISVNQRSSAVTSSSPQVSGFIPHPSEELWALKDVSFEVKRGEVLGIIGRNGAGKSTLLKILTRITEPTSGRAVMRGRVASLLEVGTGFHPELTGRENIFLNGAILGMRKKEIEKKFDEIVAFSEVERFIDTPVKRYSSGMYVRLAFAVAAHLEPEILLIDEVLAVGDAAFQKKCLGKMGEVAHKGRTVLFVSHNMGMINSLCGSAVLLESGKLEVRGSVSDAISTYYSGGHQSAFHVDFRRNIRPVGDELATLLEGYIENNAGKKAGDIDIRSEFKITMIYQMHKQTAGSPFANFHVYNSQGVCVFVTAADRTADMNPGIFSATCSIPGSFLNNDTYSIGLALTFTYSGIHVSFFEQNALSVIIRDPMEEALYEDRKGYAGIIPGTVRPKLNWKVKRLT